MADTEYPERLHFMGIRGQGMSALAALCLARGHSVTACDVQPDNSGSDLLHRLAGRLPITIELGNDSSHVSAALADGLVVASYIPDDHPEILAAYNSGIAVMRREEVLGRVLRGRHTLAVAGVAGKSTTTAMAAHAAMALGSDPVTYVGAYDPNRDGRNYHDGRDGSAIVEACEYRQAFLSFPREIAVITNLHWGEHVDCYKSREEMDDAFIAFASQARTIIAAADPRSGVDRLAGRLPASVPVYRVGFAGHSGTCDVAISDREVSVDGQTAVVSVAGERPVQMRLQVPGKHNLVNAAMAAMSVCLWKPTTRLADACDALSDFRGLGRRLELIEGVERPRVIDDYAHHPAQLDAAAESLREVYPRQKIGIFFQPSVFRRTALLRTDYVRSLAAFDYVFVQDVALGTCDTPSDVAAISSLELVSDLRARGVCAEITTADEIVAQWGRLIGGLDVLVVCGARKTGGVARRFAAFAGRQ